MTSFHRSFHSRSSAKFGLFICVGSGRRDSLVFALRQSAEEARFFMSCISTPVA